MSSVEKDVIRIRVKKCEGLAQPEYKKLSVDPQLTSYEVLKSLLTSAFGLKDQSFAISYAAKDTFGTESYVSLLSDWDLDAAFSTCAYPFLRLKVDLKPFEPGMEDWDINSDNRANSSSFMTTLTGITSHVGRTVSTMSKAIGLIEDEASAQPTLPKPPLTDPVFKTFMDPVGHMVQPREFRLRVYQGGVDPALRSVVWRHLLNVYPEGLSGKERFQYGKDQCKRYYELRQEWRDRYGQGDTFKVTVNMVKKDVLRTDRTHPFYAGADDSDNLLALFNLLVTWALTHPEVGYVQGMSDLASPLLVVQADEAFAYLCFCGLMTRMRHNFSLDNTVIETKFNHLALLLQHEDPEFFAYLRHHGAEDLFFCYRWLLLELKREFPFEDALRMLEVMWSSLPPDPPDEHLPLADPGYQSHQTKEVTSSSSAERYVRLRSLRRSAGRSTSDSLNAGEAGQGDAVTPIEDEEVNSGQWSEIRTKETASVLEKSSSIDQSLEEERAAKGRLRQQASLDNCDDVIAAIDRELNLAEDQKPSDDVTDDIRRTSPDGKEASADFELDVFDPLASPGISFTKTKPDDKPKLPAPAEFGLGNPFLMFLTVTLLLQQRDVIIRERMDYNELAMHFDKMVRKHDMVAALLKAQAQYGVYLRGIEEDKPVLGV